MYHHTKRYYDPDIASVIVGLYVQSLSSSAWPTEGIPQDKLSTSIFVLMFVGEFWLSWLQRRDLGDASNPIDLDDEPEMYNIDWKVIHDT